MKDILRDIPWAGVGFIFSSIAISVFWLNNPEFSLLYIVAVEIALFFFFFYLVDAEISRRTRHR
jgi:hypothetical protein